MRYISYIDFGDNFNFGELVFLASLIVGELVCRRVGLSASWCVGELVCRRVCLSASWLSASWFVGELSIKRLTQVMLINDKCYRQIFTEQIKEINKSLNIQSVLLWPEHMHVDICAIRQWRRQ